MIESLMEAKAEGPRGRGGMGGWVSRALGWMEKRIRRMRMKIRFGMGIVEALVLHVEMCALDGGGKRRVVNWRL